MRANRTKRGLGGDKYKTNVQNCVKRQQMLFYVQIINNNKNDYYAQIIIIKCPKIYISIFSMDFKHLSYVIYSKTYLVKDFF